MNKVFVSFLSGSDLTKIASGDAHAFSQWVQDVAIPMAEQQAEALAERINEISVNYSFEQSKMATPRSRGTS